jgi:dTMP kinase
MTTPLKPDSTPGLFIVLEGIDGAGTTTQAALLQQSLAKAAIATELTNEPSDGPIGAVLRQAINRRIKLSPEALALAFAADRIDHLTNKQSGIEKSLGEGKWVVSDRYVLSSYAYQSHQGVDLEWLIEINSAARKPDVTIFVDTPPDECAARIRARSSNVELFDDMSALLETDQVYREVIKRPEQVGHLIVVDGTQAAAEIGEEIRLGIQGWRESRSRA